jgi:hypothetical protein
MEVFWSLTHRGIKNALKDFSVAGESKGKPCCIGFITLFFNFKIQKIHQFNIR